MDTNILITIAFVLVGGIFPPLVWLWFWLREDRKKPEPKSLILATFVGGMIAVPIALFLEQYLANKLSLNIGGIANLSTGVLLYTVIIFVVVEELLKYLAAQGIAFPNRHFDEPIDAIIYMITAALGFAALENTLFLIKNLSPGHLLEFSSVILNLKDVSELVIGNNLRFIGANVLHVVASGVVGVFIGLSFYKKKATKFLYFLMGISAAILLHTLFNFLIIRSGDSLIKVFVLMWIAAIVLILLFEKVKRVKN